MSMNDMRGIWRGKRTDNGEWIEGYYSEFEIAKKAIPCIIPFSPLTNVFPDNGVYQVNPSTLGECTGLRDKNGTPIFEGDIVLAYYNTNEKKVTGTICYEKFMDTDSLDDYGYLGWYVEVNGHCISILQPESDGIYIEVIGNIHDNPELLKGDADDGQD